MSGDVRYICDVKISWTWWQIRLSAPVLLLGAVWSGLNGLLLSVLVSSGLFLSGLVQLILFYSCLVWFVTVRSGVFWFVLVRSSLFWFVLVLGLFLSDLLLSWMPCLAWPVPLGSHLPLVDGDPVRGGKPLVTLDVVDAVLQVPEALGQVHLQQVPQEVLQVGAEVRREPYLCRQGHPVTSVTFTPVTSVTHP